MVKVLPRRSLVAVSRIPRTRSRQRSLRHCVRRVILTVRFSIQISQQLIGISNFPKYDCLLSYLVKFDTFVPFACVYFKLWSTLDPVSGVNRRGDTSISIFFETLWSPTPLTGDSFLRLQCIGTVDPRLSPLPAFHIAPSGLSESNDYVDLGGSHGPPWRCLIS